MGTSYSRPKICKVTPKEEQPFHPAVSKRMTSAAQHLPQHQHRILQHVPQIVPPPPDLQNEYPNPVHSIIKSYPPQRAKAWQPTACLKELPAASKTSNKHVPMAPVGQYGKQGDKHSGVIYKRCSEENIEAVQHKQLRNQGGFLQAQTLLISQATKKRQSHQRHLRKQRTINTSSVGGAENVQRERIQLVSRPTHRDIFWDETKKQHLDLRELLQPSPPLTDANSGTEKVTRGPKSELGLKDNSDSFLNESVTKLRKRIAPYNLPWLEDFQQHEHEQNSQDLIEGQWGHKPLQDTSRISWENKDKASDKNSTAQVNSVYHKQNNWRHTDTA